MTDDIEVMDDTVDTTFFVDNKRFTTEDVLEGVDNLLAEIKETGEFEAGTNALRSMSGIARVTGWASAKLLHGMMFEWTEQGHDPEKFTDYIKDMTFLKPLIVERYIMAWTAIQSIPQISEQLLAQPIKNGIALGSAIAQGYELTDEQLEELADAKSNQEFLSVIRDVKGKPARKSSLTIYLERDGTLKAWQSERGVFIGDLDVKSDDPMVKKAIERITISSGIIKK